MSFAARVTDLHVCPLCDGVKPHVGGPIMPPGCPTVVIGYLPAARIGDIAACAGVPDTITGPGAPTVIIGGMPAARMGDQTAHGGIISPPCCPTVIIGASGAGGAGATVGGASGSPGASVSAAAAAAVMSASPAAVTAVSAEHAGPQSGAQPMVSNARACNRTM